MYISANHGHVEFVYFIKIVCYDNTVLMVWLGLGTKSYLFRIRKRSCLGLDHLVLFS